MYQTEKSFYQAMKKNLSKVHWQRIETGALQQGVPDVNACYGGYEFWVELKCTTNDTVSLTPFQIAWHMRRATAGGISWILVADSKRKALTLHTGNSALELSKHGVSSSKAFEHQCLIDWPLLLRQLCLTDRLID